MSATAAPIEKRTEARTADVARDRRPGMARLMLVELRKMTDTRAGFWLPIAVAAITLIVVVVAALAGKESDHTTVKIFHAAVMPGSFLLPVLGVLLVCGEWSQRTTLNTFTLVPNRGRVMVAKILASVLSSIALLVVCVVLSLLAGLLLSDTPGGAGGLSGVVIGQGLVFLGVSMLIGVAFGAAILVSAPAIVAYLLLPTVWAAVAGSIDALATVDKWLDTNTTLGPLTQHGISALQWGRIGVSLIVWMALPLAFGWTRIRRSDIG